MKHFMNMYVYIYICIYTYTHMYVCILIHAQYTHVYMYIFKTHKNIHTTYKSNMKVYIRCKQNVSTNIPMLF
jgi:hypothetical protein